MEVLKPMDPDNWVRWPVNNERMEEYWWFERTDVDYWYKFSENYGWSVMVSVLVIYWVGMSLGRYYMKDRKAYTNLIGLIATYNIAMSIFSIITLFKIGPVLMEGFSSPNWLHNTLCQRSTLTPRIVFWTVALSWSKVVQLIDSFILLSLKKEVPFFQMYHHSIVIFIPIATFSYGEPMLIAIGVLNLIQHIINYPYFAAKVLKIKLPRFLPKIILLVEIVQMILGLGIGIYTLYVIGNGGYCIRHPRSIAILNFAYFSMLILVVYETYNYFTKPKSKKKSD